MKKKNTAETTEFFEPSDAILKRARRLMSRYTIVIEPSDGEFIGYSREMPGVIGDGRTIDECARNLAFAMETVIASYLVEGAEPPPPIQREKRTEQVNVRFTRTERSRLEQESARQGFRGIGDLIRAEMIRRVGVDRRRA